MPSKKQQVTFDEVTPELLQRMADAIVEEVHPEKIVLFGSRAQGVPGPDSDVDLLVIEDKPFGKENSRWRELRRLNHVLSDFRVPIDVLVYSVEEVEEWRDSINHILARALREGRVLYERH